MQRRPLGTTGFTVTPLALGGNVFGWTADEANVGDVVIAKGIVKTDVDLGSGYAYKVLVEDVSFRK